MNLLRRSQLVGSFRSDGYENTLSGLAGATRSGANKFVKPSAKLGESDLKALYDYNWLARRGIDMLVDQALRKPLVGARADFAPFHRVNDDFRFPGGVFRHALKMGRLFGGAVIVQGVIGSGAPLEKPLPLDKDGVPVAGEVAFLDVLNRYQLDSASRYELPEDPTKHKRTEVWKVTEGRLKDLKIHESRMLFCGGLTKVDLTDDQADRDWPWISLLQPVNEILGNYGMSWTSISHLIQEASIAWLRLRGLTDMLTTEDKKVVDERMGLLSTGRNVAKTVFLEAGDDGGHGAEEYGRTDVSFAGVPDLIRECTLTVCGAFRIPYIILMGDTPAGLNATGDSTLQQWYDTAEEYRTSDCEPKLRTLFKSTKVTVDWKWPTLWEPTAAQAAVLRAQNATADTAYFQMGVLQPKHILESRLTDGTLGINVDLKMALADLAAAEAKAEADRKEALTANARNPDATTKDPNAADTARTSPTSDA